MSESTWRPAAPLDNLRRRAEILAVIRRFFAERGVLEVETPVMARAGSTDPHLDSFLSRYEGPGTVRSLYLQTSPEFHMKRLLAAGSGPIYQISRAFRNGESGSRHNPEFAMLEWYRPGFEHHRLMDEVEALIGQVLDCPPARRCSYRALFQQHLQIDPHDAALAELRRLAQHYSGCDMAQADRDGCLDLLISHVIEPKLGREHPQFVYDFPASQAALARIREDEQGTAVACRFELYVQGMELANGYHELTDAEEQTRRFAADNAQRQALGKPPVTVDEQLVAALAAGLPDCAGVALGVDRLVMLALGTQQLQEVVAFPWERA